MSRYIPKEIVLNNLEIPEGVSILYSTWKIVDDTNTIVHYTDRDEINLTSKIFTDVFEIGKKYYVTMSMVRTDGPTIDTRPLEVQVFTGDEIYNLYPMPSVIDTPVITMAYALDNVPTNDIKFTGSDMIVAGNATHDYSHWWLTNDLNHVIWDSGKSQVNKTEIIVSGVDLKKDRFYTMHCVYTGTNRDTSGAGSITFKPNSFDELEISGDLNNTYYGYGIDTRLKDLNSDMTLFEYKLLGDDVELVSNSNTTGEIEINSYYGGEFIGDDLSGLENKYYLGGVTASNGIMYYAPYNASKVLKVDPNTGDVSLIGIDLGATIGKYNGAGILAPNGMIYFPPATHGKTLKVDPNTDTVSLIGTDYGTTPIAKYTSAVLASNGKIYCVPYSGSTTQVLKIDPVTDTTTLVGTAISNGLVKYYNAVLAPNGKIYATPGVTNQVLLLDPATDTTSLIGTDYGVLKYKYISLTLGNNGKLYSLPYDTDKVLEIDPATNTTKLIGSDYTSLGVYKYFNSVKLSNGKIYGIPADASKVLEVDPTTGATTLIGSDLGSTTFKYLVGAESNNGKIYCPAYNADRMLEIDPIAGTTTVVGLTMGTTVKKYAIINIYNDKIFLIPSLPRKVYKFDLNKYEESKNSYLLETYSEYTLRLRVTTTSDTIGWKDIKFRPKKFIVESDVWNDTNFQYENKVDVLDGKILNYDKSNYNTAFTSPNGNTYQLPNGEIILLRTKTKLGRFSIDDTTGVLTHLGDLYLPQITLNKDYNIFNFKIFSTGDVLIGVGYADYTIYHFKYDPVNNQFRYKTKYSIPNGGNSTYSEMHLVDTKVVFNTDGNNGTSQDIYIIDLVTLVLELSIMDVVNGAIKGNLVRLDTDDLIIRGGVDKSNNGMIVNSGRLLHVKNANGGIKLIGNDYSYLGLTQLYRGAIIANNGMIYCIPFNASKVLKINPITGVTTLIGIDLGDTAGKYTKGLKADNGMIYAPPCTANKVLKINPNTDTVSLIGTDYGTTVNKYVDSGVLAVNGKLYAAPNSATITQVLEINPTTDTTALVGSALGAVVAKYTGGISASNGMIYFIPYTSTQILKLNPNTGVTTLIGPILDGTTGKYIASVVAGNGKIYFVPANSNKILELDPNTDNAIFIGSDLGTTNSKYVDSILANNGMIYFIPHNASKVLKLNPTTGVTTLIGTDLGSTSAKYYYSSISSDGKIYCTPFGVGAINILMIDTNTDATHIVGPNLGNTSGKYWISIIYNTKIYLIPYSNMRAIEIDPSGFKVDTTNDSRISLPTIGVSDESALQSTLRNNELILGNFNRFKLKSNSRDEIRLIGSDLGATAGKYYNGVLAPNGKIYYAPYNANQVLMIDPVAGTTTLIGTDLGATAGKYYKGVLAPNGKIYYAPYNANQVLMIDPATNTTTLIGTDLGAIVGKYVFPILANNGMIYCAPHSANQALMIDPVAGTTTLIGTDLGSTAGKYIGAVLGNDGKIYCVPYSGSTTQVLKIDTTDNITSLIGSDLGATAGKYHKGVLHTNGKIYFPPHGAGKVLMIDPATNTTTLIGTDYGATNAKYSDGVIANNGKIYATPNNANQVLMIDPATNTTTLIGTDYGATASKYAWGVLAPNGKIYGIPVINSKVLEIDPATNTTTLLTLDLGTISAKYYGVVLANNGKIYTAPFNAGKVLEIDPQGVSNLTFNLKKLPADKNTMTDTSPFIFKSNGGEDFKFTIFLNNGKRIFMSHSKDKPKMIVYK